MRATICVCVDEPDAVAAAEAWFARWRPHLAYCSENTGCGCCVDNWDVDAPPEAIAELPDTIQAMSVWANPELLTLGRSRKGVPAWRTAPRRQFVRKRKNKPST